MKKLIVAAIAMMAMVQAQAGLIVDVTSNGEGSTLWTFSGSATVGGSGGWYFYGVDESVEAPGYFYWEVADSFKPASDSHYGDAYFTDDFVLPVLSGDGKNWDIVSIGVSNSGTLDYDTIGFFVGGGVAAGFSAGDVVSWSGQAVLDKDISLFETGTTTSSTPNHGWQTTLDLVINVHAVPEPGTLGLLGLGLVGLLARRRRLAA